MVSDERKATEKVLVLGTRTLNRAVESFGWDELPDALNVADFDVVILYLVPLTADPDLATRVNRGSLPKPDQVMRQMRDSDSNAMIVIGGTPNLLLQREEKSRGGVSFSFLSSLFPILPRFHTKESGEQIRVIEENFGWYLQPLAMRLNCRHRVQMRAYSMDLRRKVVEAVQRGMSKAQVARAFGVGIFSVKRYVNLTQQGESLCLRRLLAKNASSTKGQQGC